MDNGIDTFNHLPSGYNDNKIVLLPRDPYWLFAYWEISSEKRNKFISEFGHTIWEKSIPSLKLTNISKNHVSYITINDFSNNWYINVPDSNCIYIAEIGRKISDDFFVNLATSNPAATPNDTVCEINDIYFINIHDMKKGKFKLETRPAVHQDKIARVTKEFIGTSSLEVLSMNMNLGISSETIIK